MPKSKKTQTLCGVPTLNVQWSYRFKKRKKTSNVLNAHIKSVQNASAKLIRARVAIQYFKNKLNHGRTQMISRGAKNVVLLYKKYQDVITCLALYVDMSGVGYVDQTIVKDTFNLSIPLDVLVCRIGMVLGDFGYGCGG